MDHLDLFTDGGAIKIGNDYYGSSAYVIRFKNRYFTKSVPVSIGTNNHFELLCIRDGLRTILNGWSRMENIELRIVSDSQYSISCVTDYFDGWVKRNGKYFREISKANIKEVSVVMAGANPKAKITKSEGDDETMPEMNEKLVTISEEQYQKTLKVMENYEKTVKTLEDASKTLEAYKKMLDEAGEKTEPKTGEELEVIKKQYTDLEEKFTKQEAEYKKAIETLSLIHISEPTRPY